MGSMAHIAPAKRLLAKDTQRLEDTGIGFSVGNSEALLAYAQAKDEALAGKSKDMIVESDGVLQMGDRLCVANVDRLRHVFLEEAQNSKSTIHPGSTKMYHDLKQFYWWEVMIEFIAGCSRSDGGRSCGVVVAGFSGDCSIRRACLCRSFCLDGKQDIPKSLRIGFLKA
uniref:Uncharacterized protein LOC104226926 n=2 Tax=Nicotiana sylvestris TaxID=4096 RepID=A0A1U7WBG3_NICSY|nr:PREDICTED: uncharacterized protein LOC104226926 [Nicotiana sylvestris]